MSNTIRSHIWEHSQQRGSVKLLLVAIAEYASDEGWAWPGAPELAIMLNVLERQVRKLVAEAERSGELVVFNRVKEAGSERHYSNVYYLPTPISNPLAAPDHLPGIQQVTTLSARTWGGCLAGQGVVSSETPSPVSSTTGGSVAEDRGRVSCETSDPLKDPLLNLQNDPAGILARARASPPSEKELHIWEMVLFVLTERQELGQYWWLRRIHLLAVERPTPLPPSPTEHWMIGVETHYQRDECTFRLARTIENALRGCNGFLPRLGTPDLTMEYVVVGKEKST